MSNFIDERALSETQWASIGWQNGQDLSDMRSMYSYRVLLQIIGLVFEQAG
jgi:hypothetical protein